MSLGRQERFQAEQPVPTPEPAPITAPPGVIHCCVCLNQRKERLAATTIVSGYAVCDEHIELAGSPKFSIFNLGSSKKTT